jgi:hypothetical protein
VVIETAAAAVHSQAVDKDEQRYDRLRQAFEALAELDDAEIITARRLRNATGIGAETLPRIIEMAVARGGRLGG